MFVIGLPIQLLLEHWLSFICWDTFVRKLIILKQVRARITVSAAILASYRAGRLWLWIPFTYDCKSICGSACEEIKDPCFWSCFRLFFSHSVLPEDKFIHSATACPTVVLIKWETGTEDKAEPLELMSKRLPTTLLSKFKNILFAIMQCNSYKYLFLNWSRCI